MINDPTHLKTEVHVGNIRASNGKQCALGKEESVHFAESLLQVTLGME